MKRIFRLLVLTGAMVSVISMTGCAYGMATSVGKDYVVVLRQDGFLFGALRKAFVCKATTSGLTGCRDNENP
ncbi:MAG: hypothetical protein FJ116_08475 [Deltaproteobacteria bacterium]|nr:hypothetical protein [Deltaproteobacteria bacterium]